MHFGVLGRHSYKHVSQHLFYFLVDDIPFNAVILLELRDEILVFDLLEVTDLAVVHYCKLSLVCR
jgi:hypothetical protein